MKKVSRKTHTFNTRRSRQIFYIYAIKRTYDSRPRVMLDFFMTPITPKVITIIMVMSKEYLSNVKIYHISKLFSRKHPYTILLFISLPLQNFK